MAGLHGVLAQFLAYIMDCVRALRRVLSGIEEEINRLYEVLVEGLLAVLFAIGLGGKERIVTAHRKCDSGLFK